MAIPTHILSPLVDALAELYPEAADVRAMIRFAGLDERQIDFSGKAGNTWSSVVREAELQGRTSALLARAQAQYPNYAPLTAASEAYAMWAAAGRPGPSPVRPSSGGRRIPLWLWLAAGTAAMVLLVLGLLNGPLTATSPPVALSTWQPPTSPMAFDWVEIPAGEFTMGSDPKQDSLAQNSEQPQRSEFVDTFWVARTEVTVAQFAAFVEVTGYQTTAEKAGDAYTWRAPGGSGSTVDAKQDHPVTWVSWDDAQAFSAWAGVRLPTEAEWEKACRGTEDSRIYPWGSEPPDSRLANYNMNEGNTTAVGSYPAGKSPYGLLDMSGNAWEWTQTKWRSNYDAPADNSPQGDAAHVLRGGSFSNIDGVVRCAARAYSNPDYPRSDLVGFRVVVSP